MFNSVLLASNDVLVEFLPWELVFSTSCNDIIIPAGYIIIIN